MFYKRVQKLRTHSMAGQDSCHVSAKSWILPTHIVTYLWALSQALSQSSGRHRGWHICAKEATHTISPPPRHCLHDLYTSQYHPHTHTPTECWVVCLQICRFMQWTPASLSRAGRCSSDLHHHPAPHWTAAASILAWADLNLSSSSLWYIYLFIY